MGLLLCPNCGKKELFKVVGIEPYSCDHLQCSNCDSTYINDDLSKSLLERIYELFKF